MSSTAVDHARTHARAHPPGRADVLLSRLQGVVKSGNGWRAKCPSCDSRRRDNVSIAELDGRVLVHCFAGCEKDAVLAAVGLTWKDLAPPRAWPLSPEDARKERQRIREAGIGNALATLRREVVVLQAAHRILQQWRALSDVDADRLAEAAKLIDATAAVFVEPTRWRPK